MKISVTQWHIDTGVRLSCMNCPVANAITASLPAGQRAVLDEGRIRVLDAANQILWSQEQPVAVKDFIDGFDRFNNRHSDKVKPFEFEIGLT